MSTADSNPKREQSLSTAQEYFVDAIFAVMSRLEDRLYRAACVQDGEGNWKCMAMHQAYALSVSVHATRFDFTERYRNCISWARNAENWSAMAWDVFFVWRMASRYLHRKSTERAFWNEVMAEWRHQMNMWVFHQDFFFIDGVDEFAADPCLHPTWNWYTPSPKDEARRKRRIAKLQRASEEAKRP